MMTRDPVAPLRAERFLREATRHLSQWEGTYIHDAILRDYHEKTGQVDGGYGRWLDALIDHLQARYDLHGTRILDFGSGTGELVVRMNVLGHRATGIDLHVPHLRLARILAEENGLDPSIFVHNEEPRLPFEDGEFGIVTLFSVLEHLSDDVLEWLLPELQRICSGVVFVLVPNRLKVRDDHTGLAFAPWMPRWLATRYIKLWGHRHQYHISDDGSWDVHFRWFRQVVDPFRDAGFTLEFPPDELVFPSLEAAPPIHVIGKQVKIVGRTLRLGLPLPYRRALRRGTPRQAFYPYLNLVFRSRRSTGEVK